MKCETCNSCLIHVKKTLLKYNLYGIHNFLDQPIKNPVWKRTLKEAVNKYLPEGNFKLEIRILKPLYQDFASIIENNEQSPCDVVWLPSKQDKDSGFT